MDPNAFMRHAAPTRETGAVMPSEISAAAGLDPYLINTLFSAQAAAIDRQKLADQKRVDERRRLASAVARLFATDDGKLLRGYLDRVLSEPTFLALKGLGNDEFVQIGAFREGCNATIRALFELEREAET
jgi:hypothetical protein